MIGQALVETGTSVIARVNGASTGALSPNKAGTKTSPDKGTNTSPDKGTNTSPKLQPSPMDASQEQDSPPLATEDDPTLFRMAVKHGSLQSLWEEWFGLGVYEHDIFGGVNGRNVKFPGWRKKARIDPSHFSRHKRIIDCIIAEAKTTKQQPEQVLAEWEPLFQQSNFVTGNLVVALQHLGKIKRRQSRGKTKKHGQQQPTPQHQQQQ